MKARILSGNIVSPLGGTTEENFSAVREGRSALTLHEGTFGIPEPFTASLISREKLYDEASGEGITDRSVFETAVLLSASRAIRSAGIDPSDPDTRFILSTIKGDNGSLHSRLAAHFGNPNPLLTVSNACISGLAALIHAKRLLEGGFCKRVVVTGCEIQSRFIVSGFQSLKALSPRPCRPFDKNRDGLNLGEASATAILTLTEGEWELGDGAVRNDANHISGPSRTGEGSYNALCAALRHCDRHDLAFINVHGTATLYNDEMESIALSRAGLLDKPVNALKGYFGHTMGAAGILETLLSMKAVESGIVLPTRGLEEIGVTYPVNVSPLERPATGNSFIKLLSGFGGVNGALLLQKGGAR